ncbi:hypothetical protein FLW53_05470 [Microbispora sp. SCL1-1]|uniref:hypothetical protein n=1 Tax=unclassified Microbispora TaxID=2614687 RepID=UPI00115BF2FB|nr:MULTISPECIES: hypothetical protein [unclassified Microbispora]NJP23662.1 hypothetical protein [Microbispora sp. CL1-1]TQS15875.1 hypothetical protein FLW53_05470 [Microbispora sp. SCL1-1]
MVTVVPSLTEVQSLAKVRDIRTALRRRPRRNRKDRKIVDFSAYTGGNVIRFPRTSGPTSAA